MAKELWDACDCEGNLLGFDLVRDEPIPDGVWHLVSVIFSITPDGRILVTKRHPAKAWGGYWEITGGGVLKGETPLQGAFRELREETGIQVSELIPIYVERRMGIDTYPTIYHNFLAVFDPDTQPVRLQESETVDYRLLPYADFKSFILSGEFVTPVRQRILDHWDVLDRAIAEHIK